MFFYIPNRLRLAPSRPYHHNPRIARGKSCSGSSNDTMTTVSPAQRGNGSPPARATPILESAKAAESMLKEYQTRWPGSQYRVGVYIRQG